MSVNRQTKHAQKTSINTKYVMIIHLNGQILNAIHRGQVKINISVRISIMLNKGIVYIMVRITGSVTLDRLLLQCPASTRVKISGMQAITGLLAEKLCNSTINMIQNRIVKTTVLFNYVSMSCYSLTNQQLRVVCVYATIIMQNPI